MIKKIKRDSRFKTPKILKIGKNTFSGLARTVSDPSMYDR